MVLCTCNLRRSNIGLQTDRCDAAGGLLLGAMTPLGLKHVITWIRAQGADGITTSRTRRRQAECARVDEHRTEPRIASVPHLSGGAETRPPGEIEILKRDGQIGRCGDGIDRGRKNRNKVPSAHDVPSLGCAVGEKQAKTREKSE